MKTNSSKARFITSIGIVFVILGTLVSGCAAPGRTATQVEVDNEVHRITKRLQLREDIDWFLMQDRPLRLNDKFYR